MENDDNRYFEDEDLTERMGGQDGEKMPGTDWQTAEPDDWEEEDPDATVVYSRYNRFVRPKTDEEAQLETGREDVSQETPSYDPGPEPVYEPDPEPVYEPDSEPVYEPEPEPVYEPDPEPVYEPDPEPVYESEPEPAKEPDPVPEYRPAHPVRVPEAEEKAPGTPPAPPKKQAGKKRIIPIAIAAALVIAAAVSIPLLKRQNDIKRYNEGAELLESGDYNGAYEVFSKLGSFEDSAEVAEYARRGMGYTEAAELMEKGEYARAAEVYDGLSGFKDSRELAAQCLDEDAYQKAVALFDAGDFAAAKEAFLQLKGVHDADDYVTRCDQESAYLQAVSLFDTGEYTAAREMFLQLKGVHDADDYVTRCEQEEAYLKAVALYDAEDYTAAKKAFSDLNGFRDSGDYVTRCTNKLAVIAYNKAIKAGEYQKALDILDSGEGEWEDIEALRTECKNHLLYEEAQKDLADGLNYTAYKKFISLGSFLDAAKKAESCKVTKPTSGELYRNSKYKARTCLIQFKTPNNGSCTYLKLYAVTSDGKEVLACTVFIRANKTVSVRLPKGDYVIKYSYGFGDWFGETEMFGSEGSYSRLIGDGQNGGFMLRQNFYRVLTFGADKGDVGSTGESMGSF